MSDGYLEEHWSVCGDCNPYLLWYGYGIPVEGFDGLEDHEKVVDSALEDFEDGGNLTLLLREGGEFSNTRCDCCMSGVAGPRYRWELIRED